ncbi:MAG TPA: hypothetical protein VHV83_11435, partial [Armatimonadota bacterium]|nr:hypothetical protein [Armatimonadota bacterium]
MSTRGWIVTILAILLLVVWLPGQSEEATETTPAQTPATAPTTADSSTPSADTQKAETQKAVAEQTVTQKQITYGDFSIKADTLNIFGDKNDLEKLTAQGNVEIRWPLPANNGMPIFLTFNAKSMVINSQQKTDKASGKITTFHTLNIQNAELTTCDEAQGHRHYGIHVKSFTIYPDQRYVAPLK